MSGVKAAPFGIVSDSDVGLAAASWPVASKVRVVSPVDRTVGLSLAAWSNAASPKCLAFLVAYVAVTSLPSCRSDERGLAGMQRSRHWRKEVGGRTTVAAGRLRDRGLVEGGL
jgi:hypothetical protein